MTSEVAVKVGDWVVIGRTQNWHPRIRTFDCGEVTRVTARQVYAKAHCRTQHPIESVTRMQSETEARLFVERAKSAYAQSKQREVAAWKAYDTAIAKILPAPETRDDE